MGAVAPACDHLGPPQHVGPAREEVETGKITSTGVSAKERDLYTEDKDST